MKTMQHFTGAAAKLIAAGGTPLARLVGLNRSVRPGPGKTYVRVEETAGAELVALDGQQPLFAVFFPGTSELITLETQHIVDLANAERLRLMADEARRANGTSGIHTIA
jgi:hypothetical protein